MSTTSYYQRNREKVLARVRAKRAADPEADREKQRAWRAANRERARELSRSWWNRNRKFGMLKRARDRAELSGHEFNITLEDIVIPEKCPIFGVALAHHEGGSGPNSPSLDRIDSTKGYVRGNVWVISQRANQIKNDGTPEEHELIARAVRARLQVSSGALGPEQSY